MFAKSYASKKIGEVAPKRPKGLLRQHQLRENSTIEICIVKCMINDKLVIQTRITCLVIIWYVYGTWQAVTPKNTPESRRGGFVQVYVSTFWNHICIPDEISPHPHLRLFDQVDLVDDGGHDPPFSHLPLSSIVRLSLSLSLLRECFQTCEEEGCGKEMTAMEKWGRDRKIKVWKRAKRSGGNTRIVQGLR